MNFFRTMLLLAALTALFMGVGYLIGGTGGMLLAFLFAIATNAFAFWNSDKMVLRMHGAEPVTRASAPELWDMVAGLAREADLPMPKVYIIRSEQPNAFATGRNPENAAVAATTGLMQLLTREELAGVMAHELAHIKNRDTLTMTVVATVAGAISILAQFGFLLGGSGDRERNPLGPLGVILAVIFAPMAAALIQMTVSRTREYSADRLGARIARDPLGLADALRKISAYAGRIEMPSAERNPASAHMFIINPLSGARMDGLFSTHPRAENRIQALEAMAAEMRPGVRPGRAAGRPGAAELDPRRRASPRHAVSAPGHAARAAAAALVAGVLEGGRSLSDQTSAPSLNGLPGSERARALSLASGVLRHLGRIDAVLAPHLRKPPPSAARNALRLATAELFLDGVPPHAAVDGAVRLARAHPKAQHLAGLVNAVARRVAEAPAAWADAREAGLPDWLDRPVRAAWGDAATAAIRVAHLSPAPLDLTLRDSASAPAWAEALGAEVLPTGGLRRAAGAQVSALPGYAEGAWWVQDAGASLPARLLGDLKGLRVLDLCAAPGGKTLQLAAAGAAVTALDASRPRLARLEENMARTGLTARVVAADARRWEPEAAFDAILLDAPCSASGTIRRHPDLPHLKRDLDPLVALQSALLGRAWDWLAPGGRLVYAACSLLPAEGEGQIAAFCAARPEAVRVPAETTFGVDPGWIDRDGALRLRPDFWPERGGVDGFYAALLRKPAA